MPTIKDILTLLGDEKISKNSTLKKPEKFSKSGKIEEGLGGDFKVSLGITGEGSISLINSVEETEQQNDPEGIFFSPKLDAKDPLSKLLDPHPVVELESPLNSGYLKYTLGVNFGGSTSGSIGPIGLEVDSAISWKASYYSKHSFLNDDGTSKTISEAVINDLNLGNNSNTSPAKAIKSLIRPNDFKGLAIGDVLTFSASGHIGGGIKLDTTDLLSGSIAYSGLFNKVIPISYSAGLQASLSTRFEGDFITAVSRVSADKLEIVVRRSTSRLSSSKVQFGATAELDLSEAINVVNAYLSSITDLTKNSTKALHSKIDKLLNSAASEADLKDFFTNLTGREKNALNDWYNKLLGKAKDEIKDLIEKELDQILRPLEELSDTIKAWSVKLSEYSNVTLSLALSYEMSKLEASSDLLRFECDVTAFSSYRKDLLLYKFDSIIKDATDPTVSRVKILRFLNATHVEEKFGSSLIFRLGKWAFGNSDKTQKSWIELTDKKDPNNPYIRHAAFNGGRLLTTLQFKDRMTHGFTLEGKFSRSVEPKDPPIELKDLNYTLGIYSTFSENVLKKNDLDLILDYGFVNGTLRNSDGFYPSDKIEAKDLGIKIGTKTEIVQGITISGGAALQIIKALSLLTDDDISHALAIAMYPYGDHPGRNTLQERINGYQKTWRHIIEEGKDTGWGTKNQLNHDLKKHSYSIVYRFEGRHWRSNQKNGQYHKSMWGLLKASKPGKYSEHIDYFLQSFKALQEKIETTHFDSYRELEDIFSDLRKAWSSNYSSRWFAALLNAAITKKYGNKIPKKEIEYKFVIKQGTKTAQITAEMLSSI